ncbi:hypothetical protein LTR36_001987 [Oleoguttula mirabilis]|uniref:XPG-I domain-containing protein n=1 Tax=Oleoguttula mirabilis TaxID=1507867 RepID=A0AAV9JMX9_9PEZI|nr:hypothetical protein LTR36_001987 [Oleoguttula mirabilis]
MANAFREWAKAESLESVGPLEQFRDTRIAIDAEDYLNALLTTTLTREPLLPALGGLPFALQKHVDEDLAGFRDAGITPVFVFNGLEVASKDRAMIGREAKKAAATLSEAWSIYDQGRGDDAVVAFGKACSYRTYHIVRWLQCHLHKAHVTIQSAPYTAAAQIVYMEREDYVDAVAGSASCLVFGADKVITNFDFVNKRVAWVESKQCLGKLLMSREPFADLMLLSGCTSILPPLAELESQHEAGVARVHAARSLLRRFNDDGHTVCLQQPNDADYLAAFRKARYVIKHCPIMTGAGRVEPREAEKVPNDVHEFIGQRLPEEVYFYLARGVAGPRVLNCRTRMQVYETPPLDGGASQAYKEVVQEKLRPLRAQALALFTRLLHRYYQKTDVELVCWFSESDKRPLGVPDMAESVAATDTWHVPETALANSTGIDVTEAPLFYAIQFLSNEDAARHTKSERAEGSAGTLVQPRELLANVTWRFLHDRGYINPDHSLSGWGKALKASLDRARSYDYLTSASAHEAEEAIFMAFELLRLDVLNTKNMFPTPPFSGPPLRGTETDKANTLLISRIASLGLFRHETIGYTGPLSRHLLAYHQLTAAVRSGLRDLLEMHACHLLLSGAVARDVPAAQLTDLGVGLPFVREPDLGLALVVKSYLDELSNDAARRSDITKWFNHAVDVQEDLSKAWKLWAAVNAGIQAADSSIVSNETRKMFKNADSWLQKKRESGHAATNGTA